MSIERMHVIGRQSEMSLHRASTCISPWMILAAAAVIGLLARVWVIWSGPGFSFAVDQLFDTLAWNLVTLGQFTLDGSNPSAHVGPLYPAVLACLYALVGHRPEWVPILQVGFDLGTAWSVYRIGTILWGERIGALAAALAFLYPAYWAYDPRIRSEALLTCLMTVWLWVTIDCGQRPSHRRYVLLGVTAGLTILCKPVAMVLAVLLIGCIWLDMDRALKKVAYALVYGMTCLVLVAPWSVRNYLAFQEFIPVSAGIGAGLWMGSDPVSRGSWPMPLEREHAIWESAGITPLPHAYAMYDVQTDQVLRKKGIDRIMGDPLCYVRLIMTRAWDFWIGNSFYLANAESELMQGFWKDVTERGWIVACYSLLKRLLLIPAIVVITVCSAWVHRRRSHELLPLYLFPIGLTAGYVPFTVEAGRYALPVLPCLMVLSVALVFQSRISCIWNTKPQLVHRS